MGRRPGSKLSFWTRRGSAMQARMAEGAGGSCESRPRSGPVLAPIEVQACMPRAADIQTPAALERRCSAGATCLSGAKFPAVSCCGQ